MNRIITLTVVFLAVATLAGCSAIGYLAWAAASGRTRDVKAQYRGLKDKSVAVMVAAGNDVVEKFPAAAEDVCRAVSNRLANAFDDIRVVDPVQVITYTQRNPFWNTLRYDRLIKTMNVDRILYLDVSEYRVHEPGNPHIQRGVIVSGVGVVEAESKHGDRFAFYRAIRSVFPEKGEIGLVNVNSRSMQFSMLSAFAEKVEKLFKDHEELVE